MIRRANSHLIFDDSPERLYSDFGKFLIHSDPFTDWVTMYRKIKGSLNLISQSVSSSDVIALDGVLSSEP